ncbi:MAG: aminoacyl-tRNA hydrolase [Endomicrobium sp.]|jgi:PTH1 family peptidyl-tRNA hydrolase|nr:aminoacyl-tRNA hydrolase [Endomicrobium sp.]
MYKDIKLFIGLGNPEQRLQLTRHNYGAIILNEIAKSIDLSFKISYEKKIAFINYYKTCKSRIWLVKPIVPINLSGIPISLFMKYNKIDPKEIFVFYDDCSIQLGKYKIKMSGSSGGHNGINSLIKYINSDNFARMKLGTGPVTQNLTMVKFVLSEFSYNDSIKINFIKKIAIDIFNKINLIGLEKAVASINQNK